MATDISCYRCGGSLAALTLPLSRQDLCPACSAYLHVCRMCLYFDPAVAKQCREDDAEEVLEKERPNFCDWFKPSSTAYDPTRAAQAQRAKNALAALFGEGDTNDSEDTHPSSDAEDLFR